MDQTDNRFYREPGSPPPRIDAFAIKKLMAEMDSDPTVEVIRNEVNVLLLTQELRLTRALLALALRHWGPLPTTHGQIRDVQERGRFAADHFGEEILLRYEEGP